MISREEALLFASSITKSLAAAKGHTHFIKTIASYMRKYSRDERTYHSGEEFKQRVLLEFRAYLLNLSISIERHRELVGEKIKSKEDKSFLLIEASCIHFSLRKLLEYIIVDENNQITFDEQALEYLPGLPETWLVSKKGKLLVVHQKAQFNHCENDQHV